MIKNDVVNYIIKTIQHGEYKPGDDFLSINQIMIKFNCSFTKARNALSTAENLGLIRSTKGAKSKVEDFSERILFKNYLRDLDYKIENVVNVDDFIFEEAIEERLNTLFFDKKRTLLIKLIHEDKVVARLFSMDNTIKGYKKHVDNEKFTSFLKRNNVFVNRIETTSKSINVDGQINIMIYRNIYDKDDLFEKALFIIDTSYFQTTNSEEYPYVKENR